MDVAASAHAAARHRDALAVMRKIGDELTRFFLLLRILADNGPHGNLQNQILAAGTMHARALAVRAALGLEMVLETILDKGGKRGVSLHDHVAAMPAVAAIGTTFGNMSLTAEGHAACAAVTAFDVDANLVYEHGGPF